VGGGVQLVSLGTAATNCLVVPAPGDYDDGEIGGMIGRGFFAKKYVSHFLILKVGIFMFLSHSLRQCRMTLQLILPNAQNGHQILHIYIR
jgi:hypothetical protein